MTKTIISLVTGALILSSTIVMTSCHQKPVFNDEGFADYIDDSVSPSHDFYTFANGNWQKQHPLPAEYARYGSFDALGDSVQHQLNQLVSKLEQQTFEEGTNARKLSDLYHLSMDTVRLNREGTQPVQDDLARLSQFKKRSEVYETLAWLNRMGIWPFFGLYVGADEMNSTMNVVNFYQGGYDMGERDYYIKDDEHNRQLREAYSQYVSRMFELFGFSAKEAKAASTQIMKVETRLAKAAYSNEDLRNPILNYNKMSLDEFCRLTPSFDWKAYMSALGVQTEELVVGQVPFAKEMAKAVAETDMESLRHYLQWNLINGCTSCLSEEIAEASFGFYGKVLAGKEEMKPRWKRSIDMLDGAMGEALGEMYAAEYFPAESKRRMMELVSNLQSSLGERIANLEWMSDETKAKAQEKLAAFTVKIGYPDKWKDYSSLDIDPNLSYYENDKRISRFYFDDQMSRIGQPVDRSEWLMTPQTVNAYYNPTTNEICFPAGILQPPFFFAQGDDAINYGAIGVVIGHEMTHGFDDQGCQYDKDGNLNNWWTENDAKKFAERTDVLRRYFDSIEVAPGVHANGSFTLGENIADHGGLQVSYNAFRKTKQFEEADGMEGFSPSQRFFMAYAHVWAGNIREQEVLRRTASDPHSLSYWRVNGSLPHIGAFADAFGLKEGDAMYLPESERVSIW